MTPLLRAFADRFATAESKFVSFTNECLACLRTVNLQPVGITGKATAFFLKTTEIPFFQGARYTNFVERLNVQLLFFNKQPLAFSSACKERSLVVTGSKLSFFREKSKTKAAELARDTDAVVGSGTHRRYDFAG